MVCGGNMNKLILVIAIVLVVTGCGSSPSATTADNQSCECSFKVYQGHDKETPQELIALMRETNATDNNSLRFAVFSLTYPSFVDEIINAHNRGVQVEGIVDKSQSSGASMMLQLQRLQETGVPLKWGDNSGLMHIKLLVTKKAYASGSFNWTKSAQTSNDEVLEVGRNCEAGRVQYEKIWEQVYGKNKFVDLKQLVADKERRAAKNLQEQ